MKAIKILCVISALFLVSVSDVSAKSADNTATTPTTIESEKEFVQNVGNEALKIINSSSQVSTDLKKLLKENFAIEKIVKYVLGKKNLSHLNNDEVSKFTEDFMDIQTDAYTKIFSNYKGKKVVFTVTGATPKGESILVSSTIRVSSNKPISVVWQVRKGKIVDAVVESVSTREILRQNIIDRVSNAGGDIKKVVKHIK